MPAENASLHAFICFAVKRSRNPGVLSVDSWTQGDSHSKLSRTRSSTADDAAALAFPAAAQGLAFMGFEQLNQQYGIPANVPPSTAGLQLPTGTRPQPRPRHHAHLAGSVAGSAGLANSPAPLASAGGIPPQGHLPQFQTPSPARSSMLAPRPVHPADTPSSSRETGQRGWRQAADHASLVSVPFHRSLSTGANLDRAGFALRRFPTEDSPPEMVYPPERLGEFRVRGFRTSGAFVPVCSQPPPPPIFEGGGSVGGSACVGRAAYVASFPHWGGGHTHASVMGMRAGSSASDRPQSAAGIVSLTPQALMGDRGVPHLGGVGSEMHGSTAPHALRPQAVCAGGGMSVQSGGTGVPAWGFQRSDGHSVTSHRRHSSAASENTLLELVHEHGDDGCSSDDDTLELESGRRQADCQANGSGFAEAGGMWAHAAASEPTNTLTHFIPSASPFLVRPGSASSAGALYGGTPIPRSPADGGAPLFAFGHAVAAPRGVGEHNTALSSQWARGVLQPSSQYLQVDEDGDADL